MRTKNIARITVTIEEDPETGYFAKRIKEGKIQTFMGEPILALKIEHIDPYNHTFLCGTLR